MLALRKKKYQENLLDTAQKQLFELEQLINNVEQAQVQATMVASLQRGTDLLKKLNSQLSIEDVERLMADNEEAIAYQQEVGQLLSGQGIEEDDEDILNELAQLDELDNLDVELPEAPKNELVPEEQMEQSQPQVVKEKPKEILLES